MINCFTSTHLLQSGIGILTFNILIYNIFGFLNEVTKTMQVILGCMSYQGLDHKPRVDWRMECFYRAGR